jgi:hypothetical protein
MVLPSLLRVVVIIMVKKRLVNSIIILLFCRQWKWNHGCVVAEVAVATAQ